MLASLASLLPQPMLAQLGSGNNLQLRGFCSVCPMLVLIRLVCGVLVVADLHWQELFWFRLTVVGMIVYVGLTLLLMYANVISGYGSSCQN